MFSTLEIEMFQMIVMANVNSETKSTPLTTNNNEKTNIVDLQKSRSQDREKEKEDLVARWIVPLYDRDHIIEFEHGTTSGKRVITVDGVEILRRDWMFRLVGDESFTLSNKHCCMIRVYPKPAFNYTYLLYVDGMEIEDFIQKQKNGMLIWNIKSTSNESLRIVLDKTALDIWVNGEKIDTEGEFTDNGTKMNFNIKDEDVYILGVPSGNKKDYIHYEFYHKGFKIDKEK